MSNLTLTSHAVRCSNLCTSGKRNRVLVVEARRISVQIGGESARRRVADILGTPGSDSGHDLTGLAKWDLHRSSGATTRLKRASSSDREAIRWSRGSATAEGIGPRDFSVALGAVQKISRCGD